MLEPRHRVLGAQGHSNPGEGCGGLGALVSRHHRLRPDRGCRTRVLQPLPGEPDSGNRRVVTALVRKGESTWGTGDVKGSVALRLRHTPCLLLILGFCTKLNKVCGLTTPNEVAAVGAWLVVGERVGARPQKEPL